MELAINKHHKKVKEDVDENETAEAQVPSLGPTFSRALIEELADFGRRRLWELDNILSFLGDLSSENDDCKPEAFPQYVIRPFSSETTRSATKIACTSVEKSPNSQIVDNQCRHYYISYQISNLKHHQKPKFINTRIEPR